MEDQAGYRCSGDSDLDALLRSALRDFALDVWGRNWLGIGSEGGAMTAEELAAFVADDRALVDTHLAQLEQLDWGELPPEERAQLEALREDYRDLRATLSHESIEAEVEATIHAGRDLTPAEVAARCAV